MNSATGRTTIRLTNCMPHDRFLLSSSSSAVQKGLSDLKGIRGTEPLSATDRTIIISLYTASIELCCAHKAHTHGSVRQLYAVILTAARQSLDAL